MNLKEKVLSMKPSELVMAMVEGLKNEHCQINMDTYGESINGVCFGCAATNAIQEIAGLKFTRYNIGCYKDRSEFLDISFDFLYYLEHIFNGLRCGNIEGANYLINKINYPYEFPEPSTPLPLLTNENYKENLQAYIDYANEIQELSK